MVKQTMKRKLVHSASTETRSQSIALFNLSWERARVTQIFHHKVLRVLIFMLQITVSKLANASIQNPQKMRTDCPDTSTARHFSFSLLFLHVGERPWDLRNAVKDQRVPGTHAVPSSAHDWNIQAAATAAAPTFTSETVSGSNVSF